MDSRTRSIVCFADSRALCAAFVQDFQDAFGILLVVEAAFADGVDPLDEVVGHGGFAFDAADAGGAAAVRTHSRRPGSRSGVEKSLCQS